MQQIDNLKSALHALFFSPAASIQEAHNQFIQCVLIRCLVEHSKKNVELDLVHNELVSLEQYAATFGELQARNNEHTNAVFGAVDAYFAALQASPPFTDLLTNEYLAKGYAEAVGMELLPTHDEQLEIFQADILNAFDAMSSSPLVPCILHNCGFGNAILKQLAVLNDQRKEHMSKISVHIQDKALPCALTAFTQIFANLVVHPGAAQIHSVSAHVALEGADATDANLALYAVRK